jgi:ATP-dependent protease ClpP protease subunit
MIKMGSSWEPKYNIMSFNDSEVYFTGGVCTDSMVELVRELKKCESKILAIQNNKYPFDEVQEIPIRLHIYSNGGSAIDSFFAIDQFRMLKVPLHTIVSGIASSAASILSCVGTRRYITKNSHMLIHAPRYLQVKGGNTQFIQAHHYGMDFNEMLYRHYSTYTKLSHTDISQIFQEPDRFMNAEECLEKGLVDEIL